MRKAGVFLVGGLLGLAWLTSLTGCGPKVAEARAEKPAVTINKLALTQEELKQELTTTSWSIHGTEASRGEEPEWLGHLIERELLVQEAQRLGLDREADFMRTIERFWKEALIKQLLNRKEQEIGDKIQVYEPEIEAYYKKLAEKKQGQPIEPLLELQDEIRRTVRQNKESETLEQWIADLREKAKIVIDHEAISHLES